MKVQLKVPGERRPPAGCCWWCARDGLRRRAICCLVGSRTHYCRKHWKAFLVVSEYDPGRARRIEEQAQIRRRDEEE
jgi:hypothetical protein